MKPNVVRIPITGPEINGRETEAFIEVRSRKATADVSWNIGSIDETPEGEHAMRKAIKRNGDTVRTAQAIFRAMPAGHSAYLYGSSCWGTVSRVPHEMAGALAAALKAVLVLAVGDMLIEECLTALKS
jgi:hypothetical protein